LFFLVSVLNKTGRSYSDDVCTLRGARSLAEVWKSLRAHRAVWLPSVDRQLCIRDERWDRPGWGRHFFNCNSLHGAVNLAGAVSSASAFYRALRGKV